MKNKIEVTKNIFEDKSIIEDIKLAGGVFSDAWWEILGSGDHEKAITLAEDFLKHIKKKAKGIKGSEDRVLIEKRILGVSDE